jgi:nucleoside-diphosphate-sugar epimerase
VGRNFIRHFRNKEITGVDIKDGGMDCRDYFKTSTTKFDLVIHCGAIVGGREKIDKEPLQVATDLSIDSEMFNWAVKTGQPRVVYFSSSAAYPISLQKEDVYKILHEDDINFEVIKNPDYTYGLTKLVGEMLADVVNKTSSTKVYTFRPFSGYGADQDLTYPFPSFIKRVQERTDPFQIWGNGEQSRDFVHIDDVIQTVLNVVEADYRGPVNIATGRRTTFNELSEMMFQISGWRPNGGIQHLLDKPVGVMNRIGSPDIMHRFHVPKYTLEERIAQILDGQKL